MNTDTLHEALEHAEGFAAVMGRCPRAAVACYLYDDRGVRRARAANQRYDGQCNCNDGADTLVKGSSTCQAGHAEVRALLQAAKEGWYPLLHTAVVTRAPCRNCMAYLLESPITRLVVSGAWPDRDNTEAIWIGAGRTWLMPNKKPLA